MSSGTGLLYLVNSSPSSHGPLSPHYATNNNLLQSSTRRSPACNNYDQGSMLSNLRRKLSFKNKETSSATSSKSLGSTRSPNTRNSLLNPSEPTRRPSNTARVTDSMAEPPPPYEPAGNSQSIPVQQITASSADDRYSFLSSFDTLFLIDDSGSMAGRSWRETAAALTTITPICTAHDADGIDIYFLNAADQPYFKNVTLPSTVAEIFSTVRPGGGTPTGQKLNKILKPYIARYAAKPDTTKPLNIIVITDGEPSDDVESPIIAAARKLDKLDAPAWQVGIQFFQVGNEPSAKEHLKQLDDGLAELAGDDELRDMVDTVPWTNAEGGELTGDGILKVVLGSVIKRLDRKKSKDLHRPATLVE